MYIHLYKYNKNTQLCEDYFGKKKKVCEDYYIKHTFVSINCKKYCFCLCIKLFT